MSQKLQTHYADLTVFFNQIKKDSFRRFFNYGIFKRKSIIFYK